MTYLNVNQLKNAGFSNDEINVELYKTKNKLLDQGFKEKEIEDQLGITAYNWANPLNNVASNITRQTITAVQESGYSPYLEIGGKKGRFNFEQEPISSSHYPGKQYLFETDEGAAHWYQLEKDFQGGRWEEQPNSTVTYNKWQEMGKGIRTEIINNEFKYKPEVAKLLNTSLDEGKPVEEVLPLLAELDTYKQVTNFDEFAGDVVISPEVLKMLEDSEFMEALKNRGFELIEESIDYESKNNPAIQSESIDYFKNLLKVAKKDPSVIEKKWSMGEAWDYGNDSSVAVLAYEIYKVLNGDKDAAKDAASMMLNLQAYEKQDWLNKIAYDISAITPDMAVMLPAGAAGAWACAGPATAASAVATPIAGAAIQGGCTMGAAFAAPAVLRTIFMSLLEEDIGVKEEQDMWDILITAAKEGTKEGFVGFLTGLLGGSAKFYLDRLGVNKWLTGTTTLGIETSVMTTTGELIHTGQMPHLEDFTRVATELLVFRGASKSIGKIKNMSMRSEYYIVRNLRRMYKEMGLDPRAIEKFMKDNPQYIPEIREALSKSEYAPPEIIMGVFSTLMTRLERSRKSQIIVRDQPFDVTRHFDKETGELTVVGKRTGSKDWNKIVFELRKDGNWSIKDFEASDGGFADTNIQAIANIAESRGRRIVRPEEGEVPEFGTEGKKSPFFVIYDMIEQGRAEPTKKEVVVDPTDEIVVTLKSEISDAAQQMKDLGQTRAATEMLEQSDKLITNILGKDFLKDTENRVVKAYESLAKEKEIASKKEESDRAYREDGWHSPDMLPGREGENPFGKIDDLKLGEFDMEMEFIASHSTESVNAKKIQKNGLDPNARSGTIGVKRGFVHVGTDTHAQIRGKGLTDPVIIRTQVKLNAPLDLREFKDFDYITDGLTDTLNIYNFLTYRLPDNHPAKMTIKEYQDKPAGEQAQAEKIISHLKDKGYDSVIYKNQIERNLSAKEVEETLNKSSDDSVAIMNAENIKILGYSKGIDKLNFTKELSEGKTPQQKNASDAFYNLSLSEGEPNTQKIMTMPALVELVDILMDGRLPEVQAKIRSNEGKTMGYFSHIPGSGKESGKIVLLAEIFKDPETASKIVAHEIGHMVDWLEGTPNYNMSRGNVLGRLAALKKYMKDHFEADGKSKLDVEVIREELKNLTREWRPFDEDAANPKYLKYRFSPEELYADFFSAVMTNPKFAQEIAPKAFEGFFDYLNNKPKVSKVYKQIQQDLNNGTLLNKAETKLRKSFKEADQKFLDKLALDKKLFKTRGGDWAKLFIDQYWYIQRDVKNYKSSNVPDSKNPIFKIDEYRYSGSEKEGYLNDFNNIVILPMERAGIMPEDMGVYMFYRRVVNERSELANPRGFTKEEATKRMAEMEARMPEIADLANKIHEVRREWVIDRIEQSGVYPVELIEKIKNNDAYARFDVVEYLDTHFGPGSGARITGQKGTLKDIANPLTKTIANDLLLLKSASFATAVKTTLDFYKNAAKTDPELFKVEKAATKYNGKYREFEAPKDPEMKLITVMNGGKLEGYYINKYVVEAFERNPMETWSVMQFMAWTNNSVRTILTDINPGFWMMNAWRDYQRTVKNLPAGTWAQKNIPFVQLVQFFEHWRKGFKPAWRSIYGIPDPVIKEMFKGNMLISITERGHDLRGDKELELILRQHHQNPEVWEKNYMYPVKWLYRHMLHIGQSLERQNKVATKTWVDKYFPEMTPELKAHYVRVLGGSPAFLRKGGANVLYNNIFMFANAMKEGWRGDLEAIKRNPMEYFYKTVQFNIVPKILMYGAASGLFGEENKAIMAGVPEYDKANYIIIPLALSDDPVNPKSIYLRIPMDETGRFFGGMAWKMLMSNQKADWNELAAYSGGQLPALSPPLSLARSLGTYWMGSSPYDYFKKQDAINKTTWDAGFPYREEAAAKYFANNMGAGIVKRFNISDMETFKSQWEEIVGFPFLENTVGRFLKFSSRGYADEAKDAIKPVVQEQARDMLLVNKYLNNALQDPNYVASKEEYEALVNKADSLNEKAERMLSRIYGNPVVNMFKNSSKAERRAILKRIEKMARDGNFVADGLQQQLEELY